MLTTQKCLTARLSSAQRSGSFATAFSASEPVRYLQAPPAIAPAAERASRDFLKRLNDEHLQRYPGDSQLAARIASYELAARMQRSIPEVTAIDDEPVHLLACPARVIAALMKHPVPAHHA